MSHYEKFALIEESKTLYCKNVKSAYLPSATPDARLRSSQLTLQFLKFKYVQCTVIFFPKQHKFELRGHTVFAWMEDIPMSNILPITILYSSPLSKCYL